MMKWILLATLLSTSAFANLHLAPPDFNNEHGRAIFVDFEKAEYNITYNVLWKKAPRVKTKITFTATKTGQPIFDLIPKVLNAKLNGEPVDVVETTTPDGSKIRQVLATVNPGVHTLEIENSFRSNVRYKLFRRRVSSAFWIRDLKYRKFLEQYVPSNFEYDQYKMVMNLTFAGTKTADQDIYANGEETRSVSMCRGIAPAPASLG